MCLCAGGTGLTADYAMRGVAEGPAHRPLYCRGALRAPLTGLALL